MITSKNDIDLNRNLTITLWMFGNFESHSALSVNSYLFLVTLYWLLNQWKVLLVGVCCLF